MVKHKWPLSLIALLITTLIGSTIGCVTVIQPEREASPPTVPSGPAPSPSAPQQPGARLIINQFTASPETISAGQTVILSWDVAGATKVAIFPTVGSVGSSGTKQVVPTITTVYTLTAENPAESSQKALTVTVTASVMGVPDLIVTEIFLRGSNIYYKVKNQGSGAAKGSRTYLYINGLQSASDYVETLGPGQERLQYFSNFAYNIPAGDVSSTAVKICTDVENVVTEGDEGNNCVVQNWGFLYTYDFLKNAHQASWRSGAGELKWPMAPDDPKGSAFFYGGSLATYPEHVSYGWIQGRFAEYYTDAFLQPRSRPLVIPEKTKFTAKLGFRSEATGTDGVRVYLGWIDAAGGIQQFPVIDVYYNNARWQTYEVDLSAMAGQKTEFILRVESRGSWEQDWLLWEEVKLVQQP